jgi:hypothetical protein
MPAFTYGHSMPCPYTYANCMLPTDNRNLPLLCRIFGLKCKIINIEIKRKEKFNLQFNIFNLLNAKNHIFLKLIRIYPEFDFQARKSIHLIRIRFYMMFHKISGWDLFAVHFF